MGPVLFGLTDANPWIESDIVLPDSRVIRWRSTDGPTIEGIFMLPVGHREGSRLPLMLQIHGGPSGYWANEFDPELVIYTPVSAMPFSDPMCGARAVTATTYFGV